MKSTDTFTKLVIAFDNSMDNALYETPRAIGDIIPIEILFPYPATIRNFIPQGIASISDGLRNDLFMQRDYPPFYDNSQGSSVEFTE